MQQPSYENVDGKITKQPYLIIVTVSGGVAELDLKRSTMPPHTQVAIFDWDSYGDDIQTVAQFDAQDEWTKWYVTACDPEMRVRLQQPHYPYHLSVWWKPPGNHRLRGVWRPDDLRDTVQEPPR